MGIAIDQPSIIEQLGTLQSFEISFELSWKTLKDYLESKGELVEYPRDVIKTAFAHEIISDGELWLEMLKDRNLTSHTYNEGVAIKALKKTRSTYAPALLELEEFFEKSKISSRES